MNFSYYIEKYNLEDLNATVKVQLETLLLRASSSDRETLCLACKDDPECIGLILNAPSYCVFSTLQGAVRAYVKHTQPNIPETIYAAIDFSKLIAQLKVNRLAIQVRSKYLLLYSREKPKQHEWDSNSSSRRKSVDDFTRKRRRVA